MNDTNLGCDPRNRDWEDKEHLRRRQLVCHNEEFHGCWHGTLEKCVFVLALLVSVLSSRADFSGTFSLNPPANGSFTYAFPQTHLLFGNWVLWVGAGEVTIDTTLAPQSLVLHADDAPRVWNGYFQMTAGESGQINFSYQVGGNNSGVFYWYYRDANDSYVETDITNLVSTSAQASFPVFAGHNFGFGVEAMGILVGGPGSTASRDATITDFAFTSAGEPVVKTTMTSTNTILISWPSPSAGWVLQVNTDLASTNWSDVQTIPADDGTTRSVTAIPSGSQFFRLRK